MKSKHVIEFKDTEIGKIPKDWNVKKISEIGKARNCVQTGPFGSLLHAHDYQEEGFPLILVKHIKNGNIIENNLPKIGEAKYLQLSKYILKKGDIVFTRVGYVGNTAYIEKKHAGWLISGQMLRIRIDNPQINNRFISYFFLTENFKKIAANVVLGSTRDSINTQILKDVSIPIPAKEEQDKIASIINTIIKKIQCIEHQNKILEQIAQTIFKSWFVDFDGVTEFEDSELGNIPKGWKVDKISSVCDTFGGGTPSTTNPDYWNGRIHWLVPRDLTNSDKLFCISSERRITDLGLKNCSSQLHPENSIFMTSRATIGVFAINKVPTATNQGFIVSRPNNSNQLYYLLLNFSNRIDEFISHANGSTFLEINRGSFRELSILIPPIATLNTFHYKIKAFFDQRFENEKLIEVLTKICDALLPKLMSGKIRV